NAALDDVVPQHDADLLPVGEMFSKTKRVRNAAFAFLVGIVNVVQAPLLTVGQQSQKVAGISTSGDDQNVAHTGINQRLYRVVDHRPVVNRQQVLVGNLGKRK